MEIWLDTSDLHAVKHARGFGILHGVTTNPTIAAKSLLALEDLLEALLAAQSGPVTAQVVATEAAEMVKQGEALAAFSPRLLVKIPVTREGLKAIHLLSEKKIPVMATALFEPIQVLLAARAGAQYVAPYFSKICEEDQDGVHVLGEMVQVLKRYHLPTKLIGASLHSTEQARECSLVGVDAVTLKEQLFEEFIADHPMTVKMVDRFNADWKQAPHRKKLPF